MKVLCIIQARMASTRLYGKVMLPLGEKPIIQFMHDRLLAHCNQIDHIVIATTDLASDDQLCGFLHRAGIDYFRGDSENVLKRFYDAANFYCADVVIRLTADCPFIDTSVVSEMVNKFLESDCNYITNRTPATFPDGLDVEIIKFTGLKEALFKATTKYETEHVTPFFYDNKTDFINHQSNIDLSNIRLTLDEYDDYNLIKKIYENLTDKFNFTTDDLVKVFKKFNNHNEGMTKRNLGSDKNPGQKLWGRALEIIPNGNMLLSKNSDQHLPDKWPAYFKSCKGVMIKDLSGNNLIDCHLMGVGTNILGYGHPEVDEAVVNGISQGNMSTLNCPEEVRLAEELIRLDSWADQVRFTRTGGEASAVAIRLGRAASGKDAVAVCGYHGWHDWYLSANFQNTENLTQHLLPGLSTTGIPKALNNTTLSFKYNDFEGLNALVKKYDIGVIQMEVMRNSKPKNNFLEKVRALCNENGIVLIFDECSSGFRETSSGLYKKFNIIPDVVIYGKALGNGYAVNAILGKREVMSQAENSFISSTFWTERIGSTAAFKTLEVMQREKSWEIITSMGKVLQKSWNTLADKHKLAIEVFGIPALSSFVFSSNDHLKYKTYVTQEMLKEGILASNVFYISAAHKKKHFDIYFEKLDDIFYNLSSLQNSGRIDELLDQEVCKSGFGRLN